MRAIAATTLILLLATTSLAQPCPCDCNGDRAVRVNELTTGVGINLERVGMDRCPPADADGSASVEVNDLVAGVGAALGGCPSVQPTPTPAVGLTASELVSALAVWRSQGLGHYRYRYLLGCFCHGPHDLAIDVFDDRIAAMRDPASGEPVTPPHLDFYFTVDGLFAHLENALANADVVRASFDPTTGHPRDVFIDWYREAVDDEVWFDIRDLEPLQMAGVCRTPDDCDVDFELCYAPGDFAGCGICKSYEAECAVDDDCDGALICTPVGYTAATCACDASVPVCKPGCDGDCPAGLACNVDRHCVPIKCRAPDRPWIEDDYCPPLFTCNAVTPLPGICERTACQADADCGDRIGICVNGLCQPGPGRCDVPPP